MNLPIPHPIPYQGSKRKLAPHILAYCPTDVTRLIEPFAGSAALTIAAAARQNIQQFVLGDLNAPLIKLWEAILNRPEHIAGQYEKLWQMQQGRERNFYDAVRTRFNRTHRPDYFLYLLARCVKASVRYNAKGEFNQSPDNRRKGMRPATMKKHILLTAQLLQGKTTLLAGDYRQILEQAQLTDLDLIYFDPPYQGVCGKRDPRYIGSLSFENFVETLNDLNKRNIASIVSYDGQSGGKKYGQPLPESLHFKHIQIDAGRSSQATLLGRNARTIESLYLSPALLKRLDRTRHKNHIKISAHMLPMR